jgi:hypothetical protein
MQYANMFFFIFSKTVIVRGALYIFCFRDPTPSQRKNSDNSTSERGVATIYDLDHFRPRIFGIFFFCAVLLHLLYVFKLECLCEMMVR